MQHGYFDLEIHAKAYQDNALRRARQARLLDEARCRGQVSRPSLGDRTADLVASVRARFTRVRPDAVAPAMPVAEAAVPDFSMIVVAEETLPAFRARPRRAAESYAAMVVIARAANVPVAGQPCEINDC